MKILNKLTLKNLKLNKSRTIVTDIGILLSAALITVVAGMAASAQQTMINAEINSSGDYDLYLFGNIKKSDIENIKANRNIKAVYAEDSVGCAYLPEYKYEHKPYVYVRALGKDAFGNCFKTTLQEGRYPQNSSELVITQSVIKNSDKKFSVGDTVTLKIGDRTTEKGETLYAGSVYGETYNDSEESLKETLDVKTEKTYKIVGILKECASNNIIMPSNAACSDAFTAADENELTPLASLYIDIKDENEKDYIKIASEITGLSEEQTNEYITGNFSDEEETGRSMKYDSIIANSSVLRYKGYGVGDESLSVLYSLAVIIIAIIILASVFVIRNSFAISITEKTKLYGMLASVGATSKQIRNNVLFEGFILGLIGIPLGLLLGVGVISILITLLNVLLGEALNGITFAYIVPILPMIFAVLLSAVTIILSTVTTAIRASKIAPITAIRSNNDVKIGKGKKNKKYKSPKLISKFFGVGGDIAYKNLKRSKKKYRTTVISIIVSVAMFIAISSFVDYGLKYSSKYYSEMDYNIEISESYSNNDYNMIDSVYDQIQKLDGIKSSSKEIFSSFNIKVDESKLSSKANKHSRVGYDSEYIFIPVLSVNNSLYRDVVKSLGYNYDEVKDKGIIYNKFTYTENEKQDSAEFFNSEKIDELEGVTTIEKEDPDYNEFNIKVAGTINEVPKQLKNNISEQECSVIVSEDWMKENIPVNQVSSTIYINAENADKTEQAINDMGNTDISVFNVDRQARTFNSITLVISIFVYGFIIVITLIGITNIFNTITTNMRLRSKEFAMLKSIGMTKREFNRMIRLESLFYGIKSLIIGIPLGLIGGLAIFWAFSNNSTFDYVVPYTSIIISIVFVFAVIWMIMKFSIVKVGKQNIIETIRNDNI